MQWPPYKETSSVEVPFFLYWGNLCNFIPAIYNYNIHFSVQHDMIFHFFYNWAFSNRGIGMQTDRQPDTRADGVLHHSSIMPCGGLTGSVRCCLGLNCLIVWAYSQWKSLQHLRNTLWTFKSMLKAPNVPYDKKKMPRPLQDTHGTLASAVRYCKFYQKYTNWQLSALVRWPCMICVQSLLTTAYDWRSTPHIDALYK